MTSTSALPPPSSSSTSPQWDNRKRAFIPPSELQQLRRDSPSHEFRSPPSSPLAQPPAMAPAAATGQHQHPPGHSRSSSFFSLFKSSSADTSSSSSNALNRPTSILEDSPRQSIRRASIDDRRQRPTSTPSSSTQPQPQQPPSQMQQPQQQQQQQQQPTHPPPQSQPLPPSAEAQTQTEGQLHPEIRSVVQLTLAHAHKIYCSGPAVRRIEQLPDGNPPALDEGWRDVWAQLGGTTLSVWDMQEIEEANRAGKEVPPTYINITDAFVRVLGAINIPATATRPAQRYTNIVTINSAGSNMLLFSCPDAPALIAWASALRLAAWEKARLEEIYTAHLIRITLSDGRDAPSPLVRGRAEGWVRIRLAGQTDWKRLWMVVASSAADAPASASDGPDPSSRKRRISSLFGGAGGGSDAASSLPPGANGAGPRPLVAFFGAQKGKERKRPALTLSEVSQAFAVYPERPELINRSTLMKLEGSIGDEDVAGNMRGKEGWVLVMPELEPGFSQAREMLKWLIAIHDAFELYGRPKEYIWDPRNASSLMFAYPIGPRRDMLFLEREAAEAMDPREDRTSAVRAQLHQILADRMRVQGALSAPGATSSSSPPPASSSSQPQAQAQSGGEFVPPPRMSSSSATTGRTGLPTIPAGESPVEENDDRAGTGFRLPQLPPLSFSDEGGSSDHGQGHQNFNASGQQQQPARLSVITERTAEERSVAGSGGWSAGGWGAKQGSGSGVGAGSSGPLPSALAAGNANGNGNGNGRVLEGPVTTSPATDTTHKSSVPSPQQANARTPAPPPPPPQADLRSSPDPMAGYARLGTEEGPPGTASFRTSTSSFAATSPPPPPGSELPAVNSVKSSLRPGMRERENSAGARGRDQFSSDQQQHESESSAVRRERDSSFGPGREVSLGPRERQGTGSSNSGFIVESRPESPRGTGGGRVPLSHNTSFAGSLAPAVPSSDIHGARWGDEIGRSFTGGALGGIESRGTTAPAESGSGSRSPTVDSRARTVDSMSMSSPIDSRSSVLGSRSPALGTRSPPLSAQSPPLESPASFGTPPTSFGQSPSPAFGRGSSSVSIGQETSTTTTTGQGPSSASFGAQQSSGSPRVPPQNMSPRMPPRMQSASPSLVPSARSMSPQVTTPSVRGMSPRLGPSSPPPPPANVVGADNHNQSQFAARSQGSGPGSPAQSFASSKFVAMSSPYSPSVATNRLSQMTSLYSPGATSNDGGNGFEFHQQQQQQQQPGTPRSNNFAMQQPYASVSGHQSNQMPPQPPPSNQDDMQAMMNEAANTLYYMQQLEHGGPVRPPRLRAAPPPSMEDEDDDEEEEEEEETSEEVVQAPVLPQPQPPLAPVQRASERRMSAIGAGLDRRPTGARAAPGSNTASRFSADRHHQDVASSSSSQQQPQPQPQPHSPRPPRYRGTNDMVDDAADALAALSYLDQPDDAVPASRSAPSKAASSAPARQQQQQPQSQPTIVEPEERTSTPSSESQYRSSFAPSKKAMARKAKSEAQQAAHTAAVTRPGRANGRPQRAKKAGAWGDSSDEEEEEEDDEEVDSDGEPAVTSGQQSMSGHGRYAPREPSPLAGGDGYGRARTLPQVPGPRMQGTFDGEEPYAPQPRRPIPEQQYSRQAYEDANAQAQSQQYPPHAPVPTAPKTIWNQVLDPNRAPGSGPEGGQQRDTFVQLEAPEAMMTKAFTPHGLLSVGLQDKHDRSAKRQEELARESGASLVNVPNKPPPPQTGLLGAITGYERERKREGGVGAALTEREREKRMAEERQRKLDDFQRQQLEHFSQGGSMYGAQAGAAFGGYPGAGMMNPMMLNPMMTGMMPYQSMMGMGMNPQHMFAAQQAQQAYQQAMMSFSQAGSQAGGGVDGVGGGPGGASPMQVMNPMMTGGAFDPRMSMMPMMNPMMAGGMGMPMMGMGMNQMGMQMTGGGGGGGGGFGGDPRFSQMSPTDGGMGMGGMGGGMGGMGMGMGMAGMGMQQSHSQSPLTATASGDFGGASPARGSRVPSPAAQNSESPRPMHPS